jgi:probable addiction module antidote protein
MADYPSLDTLEALSAFLAEAFDSGNPDHIAAALATAAHSKALPELAAAAGLPREALAGSLASGELSLDATLAIMKVVDLHMPPR